MNLRPSLAKKMPQALDRSMTVGALCDETAVAADFLIHRLHGIRGACDHSRVGGIEHFQVIVAVPNGKAATHRDLIVIGDVGEAAALLKIPVAETQIDRVSLPREMRLAFDDRSDVIHDPFHFLFRARNDASGFAVHFDPLGSGMFLDGLAKMGEQLFRLFEKPMDFLFAALVPLCFWQPTTEYIWEINLSLAGDHPVWEERKFALNKALDHLCHGAPGIDAPHHPLFFAERADQIKKRYGHRWRF